MNPAIAAAGLGVCAVLLFVELRHVLVERQRPPAAQARREAAPEPALPEPAPVAVEALPARPFRSPAPAPRSPARVPGEDLACVLRRLPDPAELSDMKLLVVGGGDAAVEAALSLLSRGNDVAMCCRTPDFVGLKPDTEVAVRAAAAAGRLSLHFSSEVRRFAEGEAVLFFDGPAGRGELRLPVDRSIVLGA